MIDKLQDLRIKHGASSSKRGLVGNEVAVLTKYKEFILAEYYYIVAHAIF